MAFQITDVPEAFALPLRMTPMSAWLFHIPMVPVIVKLLRPRVLVELGTHAGDSYLAFCQAVKTYGLQTACTAVDLWTGDVHTGAYGPEVLSSLRAAHDPQYAGFSRLLQMSFDDALSKVPDGSVDLLHIDGAHDYKSVRHDFDAWLPKLSDRAVVLFHDTAERKEGFGVWQVWDEVRAGRPHASVPYGHGLGLLAQGPNVPAAFLEFLDALNQSPALVSAYQALGHRLHTICYLAFCGEGLATCQNLANQWKQLTGQPILHPVSAQDVIRLAPQYLVQPVIEDVRQMALDGLKIASDLKALREKTPGG